MHFTKMQGTGNDYIYVNGFEESVRDAPELARRISDRHFGVGSDGLVLIQPAQTASADFRMEMYNADGSRGKMCGNAIRCVAKYVLDHGLLRNPESGKDGASQVRVETDAGLKRIRVWSGSDGKATEAEVNMGPPILTRALIPMKDGGNPGKPAINVPLEVKGLVFHVTAVSMGNPHAVLRVDSYREAKGAGKRDASIPSLEGLPLGEWPLWQLGPHFENHPWFPDRVNTEFIVVRSRTEIDFRVWERGSGETLGCGTGACAAVVAAILNGWCDGSGGSGGSVLVHLRGGDLRVRWEGAAKNPESGLLEGGAVFMRGPAVEVFAGDWSPPPGVTVS